MTLVALVTLSGTQDSPPRLPAFNSHCLCPPPGSLSWLQRGGEEWALQGLFPGRRNRRSHLFVLLVPGGKGGGSY